jgi:hypothetical protein
MFSTVLCSVFSWTLGGNTVNLVGAAGNILLSPLKKLKGACSLVVVAVSVPDDSNDDPSELSSLLSSLPSLKVLSRPPVS